jgi:predicted ATP-grasp superfamily ATP-dependent carboligase
MMNWDQFFEALAKSGLSYINIGEDEEGYIQVLFDLKEKRDGGGRIYLARGDEFTDDVEG